MELKFVICGVEHSGTTLVSDIFRQVAGVDSGFECGVLLGESPRHFSDIQPFFNNMKGGWQISDEVLATVCNTSDFGSFYQHLYQNSGIFNIQTQYLFDKTPRYFTHLFECQQKINVPFIATYKDPRSLVFSDFKRTGKQRDFYDWYESYKGPKLGYLSRIYKQNYLVWKHRIHQNAAKVLCVSLEDICLNTRESVETMFSHVDFEFDVKYLLMKNLRYGHTRAPQISSRMPFEYLESLNKDQIATIEKDFSILEDWFYR